MNRVDRQDWMKIVVAVGGALWAAAAMAHPGGHGGESPFGRRPIGGEGKRTPIRLVSAPRAGKGLADVAIAESFAPFEDLGGLKTRAGADFFYVEGQGVPDHPLMIGIRAWQQQVPLPQPYVGDNAWQIPLVPVPAKKPASAKNRFLRGAIALAVNGIPIFNPLNNRGEDAFAIGELDDYGGHCGRADDYHYHLAPVHLEAQVWKGKPIAWALDGYPIYGYTEPDGSPVTGLDALNGHEDAAGNYHYHATKQYPYLNGGFHGEVTEREGQVDPQPAARPVREARPPLRGATIVGFEATGDGARLLTYEIGGRKGTVAYAYETDGSATFTYTEPSGKQTEEAVRPRGRRPGGGEKGGGREPPPERMDRGGRRPPPPPLRDTPPRDPPPRDPPGARRPRPEPATGGEATRGKPSAAQGALAVSSGAIDDEGRLKAEFTCDGDGISPPIRWEAGPAGTKEYALVLWHEAPDRLKTYWVVHGIPADVTEIPKGNPGVGTIGRNDKGRNEYDPMCSRGPGVKTYHITLYALSAKARLPADGATREQLLAAIRGLTLAEETLSFDYERGRKE
jgi:phosphatidylethanolamine-binding protein (PEBP) family uncharacterized protein